MNSTKKTSFFILWDEVPPTDLQDSFQKNYQDSQAHFDLVKPAKGYRGTEQLALEITVHVAYLASLTALLVPFINYYLSENAEIRKEEREQKRKTSLPRKDIRLVFKLKDEEMFIKVNAADCPDNLPESLTDKTTEDIEFITIIRK